MVTDPGLGYKVMATIVSVKGECSAGHNADFSITTSSPTCRHSSSAEICPGGRETQSSYRARIAITWSL